jgi:hypothetical protein
MMVTAIFYVNLFLVLGDYILVMAHSVQALFGQDSICLPTAGLLASTLMFGFSQLRTMGDIGRSVTLLSLACLAIVVVQCLVAAKRQNEHTSPATAASPAAAAGTYTPPTDDTTVLRKFSALASIGFATGSNKLLVRTYALVSLNMSFVVLSLFLLPFLSCQEQLNIRNEMKHREEAPKSLGISLSLYGSIYVGICVLAGPSKLIFSH